MKKIKYILDILFMVGMAGVGLTIGLFLYMWEYYPEKKFSID